MNVRKCHVIACVRVVVACVRVSVRDAAFAYVNSKRVLDLPGCDRA